MFCKDCGAQLPDGSRFCGSCGSEQTTPQPVKKPAGRKKKVSKALVIGICALLVVAILGAILIPMLFPKTETIYVMVSQIHYNRDETPYTRTVWEYDELGQLLCREVDHGTMEQHYDDKLGVYVADLKKYDGVVDQSFRYSYDEPGNLTAYEYEYADGMGTSIALEYEYDEDNQVLRFDQTHLPVQGGSMLEFTNSFECEYDDEGRLLGIFAPETEDFPMERQWTLYEYDKEGRLEAEYLYLKEGIYRHEFSYEDGKLSCVELSIGPNFPDTNYQLQSSVEFEYDQDGRLEKKIFLNAQGDETQQIRYEYDENGFLEEETTVSSGGSKACISYTCDEHGNIIKAEYPDGSWDEFEYETRKVTLEQADYFRRRNGVLTETDLDEYRLFQDTPLYYLIPNPLWETDR